MRLAVRTRRSVGFVRFFHYPVFQFERCRKMFELLRMRSLHNKPYDSVCKQKLLFEILSYPSFVQAYSCVLFIKCNDELVRKDLLRNEVIDFEERERERARAKTNI